MQLEVMKNLRGKILDIAKKQTLFRASDIPDATDPRSTLYRMASRGEIIRVCRGLYTFPDAEINVNHSLAEAVKRYPGGIICLISALNFHGIGTQMPYETWMMRQDGRMSPKQGFPVRFVYCNPDAFNHGIIKHCIDGVDVRIYSAARTVADCFKYRNKIGLDVAIEALREGWREKHFNMDQLWAAAKVCRVQTVMQPYVEMLVQ